VLLLTTDLQVGGVPLHLHRLARGLKHRGWQVSVACLAGWGPVADRIAADGIVVEAFGAEGPRDLRCLDRLARCLRRRRPDLLHSLLFHANMAARLVGAAAGLPARRIVCEIQTVEIERRWHLTLDNLTCRLCAVQVVNSLGVLEHLSRNAHLPRGRLRLIHGGVDATGLGSAKPLSRKLLGAERDDLLWVWVGRLDPVKGLEVLIQAMSSHLADLPVRLLLVGEGPLGPLLKKTISQSRLDNRVLLLGRRDDVPDILATADAFVLPSRTEGFPNALLEAMAAGLPCVASDVAGCQELVEHDRTGLLVPPGDPDALGAAMADVSRNPQLRERLGRAARLRILENFTLEACLSRYMLLYARLLDPEYTTHGWSQELRSRLPDDEGRGTVNR